jgi:toxin ParE1/3/4
VRIVWLRAAERNLEEQLEYIGERSPSAANALADKIAAAVARLADHPRRGRPGRPGRVTGTRELVVPGTPYIVVYSVVADYVRIHRVLHGAQRWRRGDRARSDQPPPLPRAEGARDRRRLPA